MAINNRNKIVKTRLPAACLSGRQGRQGFALLIAVIFMTVMITFGLALGSLGYKQQVLTSASTGSQYAFYAADAALECALYADQQQNLFDYASHADTRPSPIMCNGQLGTPRGYSYGTSHLIVTDRISLDSGARCADVTVYKPPADSGTTYIFSQGFDVACSVLDSSDQFRFVSRGIDIQY